MSSPITHSAAQSIAKESLPADETPFAPVSDIPAEHDGLTATFKEALASATQTQAPHALPEAGPATDHAGVRPRNSAHDGAAPRLDPALVYPLALPIHPLALPIHPLALPQDMTPPARDAMALGTRPLAPTRQDNASTGAHATTRQAPLFMAPGETNIAPIPAQGQGRHITSTFAGSPGASITERPTTEAGSYILAMAQNVSGQEPVDGTGHVVGRPPTGGPLQASPDTAGATAHLVSLDLATLSPTKDGAAEPQAGEAAARVLPRLAGTQSSGTAPTGGAPTRRQPDARTALLQPEPPLREEASAEPECFALSGLSQPGAIAPRPRISQPVTPSGAPSAAPRERQAIWSMPIPSGSSLTPEEYSQTPRFPQAAGLHMMLDHASHTAATIPGGAAGTHWVLGSEAPNRGHDGAGLPVPARFEAHATPGNSGHAPQPGSGRHVVENLLADLAARPQPQQHDEPLAGLSHAAAPLSTGPARAPFSPDPASRSAAQPMEHSIPRHMAATAASGQALWPEDGPTGESRSPLALVPDAIPGTDGGTVPAPDARTRGATSVADAGIGAAVSASVSLYSAAALAEPGHAIQSSVTQYTGAPSAASAPASLAPLTAEAILPPMNELLSDHVRHSAPAGVMALRPYLAADAATPGRKISAATSRYIAAEAQGTLAVPARMPGLAPAALEASPLTSWAGAGSAGHRASITTEAKPSSTPEAVAHGASARGRDATATPVLPRAFEASPASRVNDPGVALEQQPGTGAALRPIVEGIVVRQAALRTTPSSSSFHVVLQPSELGLVTVHVERNNAGLQVTLAPRLAETQALLDKHLPDLIAQLSAGLGDGGATHVSVVAPGPHGQNASPLAPATGGQNGAMASGHGALADSGPRQPFEGRGDAPERHLEEKSAPPAVVPAATDRRAGRHESLNRAGVSAAARIDVQA